MVCYNIEINVYVLKRTTNFTHMAAEKKRLSILLIVAGAILLVPLIAMQFTNEVNWTVFDFAVAGTLLIGTGFLIDLILRKLKKDTSRVMVLAGVLIVFLIVWMELAVGVFGSPIAGS